MLAEREALQADRPYRDPSQVHDLVPKLGKHPTNLALLALGEHELNRRSLALRAGKSCSFGPNLAVGEPDSLGQLGKKPLIGAAGHERPISLLHTVARMRQAIGQLTVVGQDHQPGTVLVEPADRVDPFRNFRKQIDHPGAARRVVIGRDVAPGFIHGVVDHLFESYPFTVDVDACGLGIDPGAKCLDDLAIDRDPTLDDVILTLPTRAQPCMSENLLKPLGLARPCVDV
jgi:hypothetical protein